MRPAPFLLPRCACFASLALAACQPDLDPTGAAWNRPTFGAALAVGGPNGASCADNIQVEPHFAVMPPPLTLYDPIDSLTDQCGDLPFDGRTRSFEVIYATYMTGEYPWKYWWRRTRSASSGATRELTEERKVSRGAFVPDTAVIDMPLSDRTDGVAALLLITDDSSYSLTDSAFLDPQWYAVGKGNLFVQHWSTLLSPLFDSVKMTSALRTTLWWRNRSNERAVDSTLVFRDNAVVGQVGDTASSFSDTVPISGDYAYTLKHFTAPLFTASGAPGAVRNSASSTSREVTVNYGPEARFTVSCQQLPCSFTDASIDADGSIEGWLWTFGDGDSATTQHPTHTFASGGWYNVRLVVTDDFGTTDDTTGVAAPLQLGMLGPTTVKPKVTCEWYADPQGGGGGMTYSWQVGGQEVGADEYLHWYTGTSGFQITLIGAAGDGQVDTAVVSVTISQQAPSCVLK